MAQPHCAYLLVTRRGNRMKVLVHSRVNCWPKSALSGNGRWPVKTNTSQRYKLDGVSVPDQRSA